MAIDPDMMTQFVAALKKSGSLDQMSGDRDAESARRKSGAGKVDDAEATRLAHEAEKMQAAQQAMYAAPQTPAAPSPQDAAAMHWAQQMQAQQQAMYASPSPVAAAGARPVAPAAPPPYQPAVASALANDPYVYRPPMPYGRGSM